MKNELLLTDREELISELRTRFEKNMNRHKGLEWAKVQAKLEADPDKLWSPYEMERTGGEPDVVGFDKKTGEYIFYDFPKAAGAFATTARRGGQGRNINRKTAL